MSVFVEMVERLNRFEFGFLCLIHQAIQTSVSFEYVWVCLFFICVMIALRYLFLHVFKLFVGRNTIYNGSETWRKTRKTEMKSRNMKNHPNRNLQINKRHNTGNLKTERTDHFAFILDIICRVRMVFDWPPRWPREFVRFPNHFLYLCGTRLNSFLFCLHVYMNCSWILLWIFFSATQRTINCCRTMTATVTLRRPTKLHHKETREQN